MSTEDTFLTRVGYEKLIKELDTLKKVQRRKLSKAIGKAREHGDISENAEYDAAKDAQAFNEKKITELEGKLARARIIENEDIPKGKAYIGATVHLKDLDTEEELQYTLVSEVEADFSVGKISIASPIGKALLGQKEKKTVQINIPAGILRYKIVKIER
ncbi:MAG: transcription elongation factor GreA [Candidatus Omnitrophota bacterium]